ncbi:type II toxin-antitoxin system RelE/ParE family toxin [Mesorhizobium tamadayense]|uniref:type II toxin-antitoxin system RelE/ParE family toxin n=1 Tax=Mesorhizobium tamadayense TaxID=425306 RepID=UPI001FDFB9C8|nr:type II toxin-antitoxin system RelE/ParE family toxin [Mesorhizobium tamadayense]
MRVVWTPEAEQDRADIWDYIAADSLSAAARMDHLFSDAAARLADFPKLGRTGKIPGTREMIPHESYRLVYEVEGKSRAGPGAYSSPVAADERVRPG